MSKPIKKRSISPDGQAPDSLDILDVKTKKVVSLVDQEWKKQSLEALGRRKQ
jgi:hypothetical protein